MHDSIKSKLDLFLDDVRVYDNFFAYWIYFDEKKNNLLPLYNSLVGINKELSNFVKSEEVGFLICNIITTSLNEVNQKTQKQAMAVWKEYFTSKEVEEIKKKIRDQIDSLPYSYTIILDFNITNKKFSKLTINVNDDLTIKGVNPKDLPSKFLYGYTPTSAYRYKNKGIEILQGELLTILFNFKGYAGLGQVTYSVNKAVKEIKEFVALGIIFNLFEIRAIISFEEAVQKKLIILDTNSKLVNSFNLEYEFSQFLEDITMNWDDEVIVSEIKKRIKHIKTFLKSKNDSSDNSAIEFKEKIENLLYWFLTGIQSINKTLGYMSLMTCFESFYSGPDNSAEKDTILIKKASYFISLDHNDRKDVYEELKEINKLRNKIIHSGYKLNEGADLVHFNKLVEYLKASIAKELISFYG